jgi:hypothetical protein
VPPRFVFSESVSDSVTVTDLMRRTAARSVAAIRSSGLVVWSGRSRIGKTTTARWMVGECARDYDPEDPSTFRALYYQVGAIHSELPAGQKLAVAALLYQIQGAPLMETVYRRLPVEALAERAARLLMRDRNRLVLVDEAGNYSTQAIRGLVLVRDVAEQLGWAVAITLIGMDDLPQKVEKIEQVRNRVHAWCYLEEYSASETAELLAALHPHFRSATSPAQEKAIADQAAYIHGLFGGVIGNIVPFLHQVDARLAAGDGQITLPFLIAVRELLLRDHRRVLEDAGNGYRPRPPRSVKSGAGGPPSPPDVPQRGTGRGRRRAADPEEARTAGRPAGKRPGRLASPPPSGMTQRPGHEDNPRALAQ